MINMVQAPKGKKLGKVVVAHCCTIAEVLSGICRLGYIPAAHHEISESDAVGTPEILVAIGSTVPHPERKHSHVPAYVGYNKKGVKIHVLAGEGSLNANVEVAIKAA